MRNNLFCLFLYAFSVAALGAHRSLLLADYLRSSVLRLSMLVLFAFPLGSNAWGQTTKTIGVTATLGASSNNPGAESVSGATHLTVEKVIGTDAETLSQYDKGDKALYHCNSTNVFSKPCYKWNKNLSAFQKEAYVGYKVTVESGYKYSLTSLDVDLAVSANFTWKVVVSDNAGNMLYETDSKTISNYSKETATNTTLTADLSGTAKLQNLTGEFYVKFFVYFDSNGKYFCFPKLTVQGDLTPLVVVSNYCISVFNSTNDGKTNFSKSATNAGEYVIENFIVPKANGDGPQCWVGENNAWSGSYSENWYMSDIPLTAENSNKLGSAAGAIGTLHIWPASPKKNKDLQFSPDSYGMSWGAGESWSFVPFSQVEGYKWQTDLVTISTTARDSWQYWVGFSASPSGYVFSTTKSKTLSLSAIRIVISDGSISGTTVRSLTADTKGKFEIYDNSTDSNWYVHFIPHYHVAYDEAGGSEVADGEYFAVNAGTQTITLPAAPTKTGYRFQGWKYEGKSYAAGATYSFTPSADITFTAVWEPTLKATTRYLIANAGVSAGALAANLTGAQVGVIKYDGTTYSVSNDISLNTYPVTKGYYYAETHLDHLGTEQDWSDEKTSNTTVQALKFSNKVTYTLQLGSLTATKIAFYGGNSSTSSRTLTIAGEAKKFSSGFIAQEVSGSFTGDVDIKTSGEIYGVLLIDVEAGERCSTPAVAITSGFNDGTRTTYCANEDAFEDWAGWTATITVEGMGEDEQCLVSWVSQSNLTDTLQKETYRLAQGTTQDGTTTFTSIYCATKGGTYNVQATVSASGKTSAHAKTSAQLRLLTAPAKPTLTANIAPGAVAQGDVVKMTSSSNTNLWEYSTDRGNNWQDLPTVTSVHTWSPSEKDNAGEYQFRCYATNTNIVGCNRSTAPSNVLTYTLVAVAKNVPILTVTNNGACEKDGGATLTASHITGGATLAWFKDGAELTTHAGKTTIQVTESGSYTVVATVDGKPYASTPAAVTVLATAKITTDLAAAYSIVQGQTGVLSVKMSGAIRYQWYQCTSSDKTGAVPLMGETNDQLSVSIPLSDGAGTTYYYYCEGAGECGGTVFSSVATVTVKALVYEACLENGDADYGFFTVTAYDSKNKCYMWDVTNKRYNLKGKDSPLRIEASDGYYIKRVTFTISSSKDNQAFAFRWGEQTPESISIGTTAEKFTRENSNKDITSATIVRNTTINGTDYGKDKGTRYITSCCVEVAPLCTPADLAFSQTSLAKDYTDGTLTGLSLPNLTNNASLPVSYTSSNPKVATVDSETGEVTPVAVGVTKITAYTEGGTVNATTYCERAASYTLTIQKPSGSTPFSASISGNTSVECKESTVLTINTPGANTPTYQWYKNGAAVSGAADASLTVTTAGTYTALVTANGYAQWTSTVTVTDKSAQPVVTRLTPFQYYRFGCGYTQASDNRYRHLFNVVSQGTHTEQDGTKRRWYPYARLIKGDGQTADRYLTNVTGWVISDPENEHMVLLDLQTLASRNAGSGFLDPGDKVVISVRPVDACGNYSEEAADSIILTVTAEDTRAVAYIVSGGSGSTVKLGGHFLTGYNHNDLMLLTGKNTWSETDADPLWYAIDTCKQYVVTPVNGYAPFNKYNYEPFDLIVLTDFPKTDKSEGGLSSATYLNDLAQLVDVKPFLSLKAHIAKTGMEQWTDKGFVALPEVPSSTQTTIDLLCYAHSVFQRVRNNEPEVQDLALDGTPAQQIEILSEGGHDNGKGLQGFLARDMAGFVNIGTIPNGDTILVACCERQKNLSARLMMLSVNAQAMCRMTEKGCNSVLSMMDYLLDTNPANVDDCSIIFDNGGGDKLWSNPANWTSGFVPTKAHNVHIHADCIVDKMDQSAGVVKIGAGVHLTINADASLNVTNYLGMCDTANNTNILPLTSPNNIRIKAAADGAGTLIHADTRGWVKASVQYYSKAYGAPADCQWQWMTTPVIDMGAVEKHLAGAWVYLWDNEEHAWNKLLRNGDKMVPFTGYSFTQPTAGTTYWIQGTLAQAKDTTITLYYNASDKEMGQYNLIGNSWTAPINIAGFKKEDFVNCEATIFMFNTGLDANGSGTVDGGQYVEVPLETVGKLDSALQVIPAMQTFQVNATGENPTLTLRYKDLVRPVGGVNRQPIRVAGRRTITDYGDYDGEGITECLQIHIAGRRFADVVHLYRNADCTYDFDNGWDGTKLFGDASAVQLFVEHDLRRFAVSTQPHFDGTRLGMLRGEDDTYTLRFQYDGTETLYLYDSETDRYTPVTNEATYTFTTLATEVEHRFLLTATAPENPSGPATGILNLTTDRDRAVLTNTTGERLCVMLYDTAGRLCGQYTSHAPLWDIPLPETKGVYLIEAKTNHEQRTCKVVR